jgi:integrase
LSCPDDVSLADFVMAEGDLDSINKKADDSNIGLVSTKRTTIQSMFTDYFESMPPDSIEETTMKTMRIHECHFLRILKGNLETAKITGQTLQNYVNARAVEKTKYAVDKSLPKEDQEYRRVSATTIRKKLKTPGTVWRWAASVPRVERPFPNRGIRWPKTDEKPQFQTWSEITRQIEQDQLSDGQGELLWDCLYLRSTEVEELLKHAKENARYSFIYPFFATAAYTGARRSELLRSTRSDFDFHSNIVTIRERKRVKGQRSTRRVPMSPTLQRIMKTWVDKHPGGPWTFAKYDPFSLTEPVPISRDSAHSHFRTTVDGSKWHVLKDGTAYATVSSATWRVHASTNASSTSSSATRQKKFAAGTGIFSPT